jgi:hypothetical protein
VTHCAAALFVALGACSCMVAALLAGDYRCWFLAGTRMCVRCMICYCSSQSCLTDMAPATHHCRPCKSAGPVRTCHHRQAPSSMVALHQATQQLKALGNDVDLQHTAQHAKIFDDLSRSNLCRGELSSSQTSHPAAQSTQPASMVSHQIGSAKAAAKQQPRQL